MTYDFKINNIMCGDSIEVMRDMPDKIANLVITDPPYLSTDRDFLKFNRVSGLDLKSYLEWSEEWIREVSRLLSDNGSLYLFAGKVIFDLYPILSKCLVFQNQISWIKKNRLITTPQLRNWFSKCEIILFFTKHSKNYCWNPIVKQFGIMESSNYQIIPNIHKNMKEGVNHPSQKPLALIEKFILASSKEGDLILDPFLGSGTMAVAAKKLGRNYLGIEVNKGYCDLAESRLKAI